MKSPKTLDIGPRKEEICRALDVSMSGKRKRTHEEPTMLHNHVDLRLGTLFREHTTLGETFEYALKRVVGESNPALLQELRLQFGASIDAVCDELEQDDQLTAEAPLEPTSKETRVQPKKRKRHHPVQLTAALHELSGFRGTFHYQTTSDTTLRTPVKATEYSLPLDNKEKLELSQGLSMNQIRGLTKATKDTFVNLTTNAIHDKLINEYHVVGGIGGGSGGGGSSNNNGSSSGTSSKSRKESEAVKDDAVAQLVRVHNNRISNGYNEQIGTVDVWCAKA